MDRAHTHTPKFFTKNKISHKSAVASWEISEHGVLQINYTGVISQAAYIALDRGTVPHRLLTNAALEWTDGAMTMYGYQPVHDKQAWPDETPPSAVIVRPDQMVGANAFNRLLLRSGILRTCWLPHQDMEARQWLQDVMG